VEVKERDTRWCSDGLELPCENGERVSVYFTGLLRQIDYEPGGHYQRHLCRIGWRLYDAGCGETIRIKWQAAKMI
jgi:hypothetical protein